ncbi:MAG: DMT family transporter [Rhizobiaceae bacterium]|nr:DMT family transporter [Rhizobiaceae bacterium]
MVLVAGGMTALVKAQGLTYPAVQLVFIRAVVGLFFILPLVWRERAYVMRPLHPWMNLSRVVSSAIALSSQWLAYTLMPLAVVNALMFSRPLVTMVMAVAMLGERVSRARWAGATVALGGVVVMIGPGGVTWGVGLLAVLANVIFGSLAIVQTRAMKDENTTAMMVFYTVGLVVITALPAALWWHPVQLADWVPLLGIGLLAQAGQYCFLRAYRLAEASRLAPVGYLSIVVTAASGYLFFDEIPGLPVVAGAVIVVAALQAVALFDRLRSGID